MSPPERIELCVSLKRSAELCSELGELIRRIHRRLYDPRIDRLILERVADVTREQVQM
jgi:hypothetical protein